MEPSGGGPPEVGDRAPPGARGERGHGHQVGPTSLFSKPRPARFSETARVGSFRAAGVGLARGEPVRSPPLTAAFGLPKTRRKRGAAPRHVSSSRGGRALWFGGPTAEEFMADGRDGGVWPTA